MNGYDTENLYEETRTAPDFSYKLATSLQQLYHDETLCDFTISVQEKKFRVHKVVMASSSDYFRAMFQHDMIENRQEAIDLKGLTVGGVECLINFSYSGSMTLNLSNIHDVMNAATFLQVIPAVNCCVHYLESKLTFDNAEEILHIAEIFSIPHLKTFYRKYILRNFLEFGLTERFLELDSETLVDYLSDDSLYTTSECMLLHLTLMWFNHKPEERKEVAFEVFSKIRYVADGWPAVQYALQCDIFKTIPKLGEIIRFSDNLLTNYEKRYLYNDDRTRVRYSHCTFIQLGGNIKFSYDREDDIRDFPLLFRDNECGWHRNHYYHPDLKKWLPLGNADMLDQPVSNATLTEVNGNAIFCGGYVHDLGESGFVSKSTSRMSWLFTASDTRLRQLASMKHARAKHAAVFLKDTLYVIGGQDDKQSLSSVEKLNPEDNTWSYVRPLSCALHSHGAVTCGNKIYISGGVEKRTVTDSVWCYDPEIDRWHKKKSMITGRSCHGMVCIQDIIYVLGGYNDRLSISVIGSMETYSTTANQWTKLTTSMMVETALASTIVFEDKILVMGGQTENLVSLMDIWEYDPETDEWKLHGVMPRPIKGTSCCSLKLKLTKDGKEETDEIYNKYANLSDLEDDQIDEDLYEFYNSDTSDYS